MGFKCSQSYARVRLVTRALTTFTRFALALLVVSGLVAPVAAIEAARVVQTVGGKPSPQTRPSSQVVTTAPEVSSRLPAEVFVEPADVDVGTHQHASLVRRYLLHRAWLI